MWSYTTSLVKSLACGRAAQVLRDSHDDRKLVCVPPSKWEAEVDFFRVGFVEQRH